MTTCDKAECATWAGEKPTAPTKPVLVKKGEYWCCPKCGSSYGAHACEPRDGFINDYD
jgi:hypothetical protein